MSQLLSQLPRHLLTQQQRLTPQLIQAMDILQLNAAALETRIAEELENNPALEVAPGEDETERQTVEPMQERAATEDAPEFGRLESLLNEYDILDDDYDYRPSLSRAAGAEAAERKQEAMSAAPARGASLQEQLLAQWQMLELDARTAQVGEAIIDALDAGGRLNVPLEVCGAELEPPPTRAQLEDALARVQQLDPPGVGARDLQECLTLQLEAQPEDSELARRLIDEHFENLQKNRLPQIAAALNVSLDEVKAAIAQIARLTLHPGLDVGQRGAPAVQPDVIVEYITHEDRYDVRLARANQRELRISDEFREALLQARGDKQTRDFLRGRIEAAAAIIDAVRFRRERLLEVAKEVFLAQRDFLDRGEQYIRVLRMSDLAQKLGCDPSTISRTVDDKWVQTPLGIFPLRRFFTGGVESEDGELLGWDSIKAKVVEIIENEDKSSPLSDDDIVERLTQQHIEIKRRTVAKYRAQLNIPNARQRRKY